MRWHDLGLPSDRGGDVRRAVLAPLLLPLVLPHGAVSAAPSGFAAVTAISGVGSAAVRVDTRPFTLSSSPDAVQLSTTGTWAALFLVEQKRGRYPFDQRYAAANSLDVLVRAPHGCAADGYCYARGGFRTAFRESGSSTAHPYDWRDVHFPEGRYVAYLLTDPGARATAVLRVKGLAGRTSLTATRPVRAVASLARQTASGRVQAQGDVPMVLRRPGGAFARAWSIDARVMPFGDGQFSLCLTRGVEGTETPMRDVTCPAELHAFLGPVRPLPDAPDGAATCQFGAGDAVNSTGCGMDFVRLEPGGYRSRWTAGRSGLSPAAGYVGIALEYLPG
jgi:hypothetical protein